MVRVRKPGERGGPSLPVPVPYVLEDPFISECPRSAITQESEDLVQIVNGVMGTQEAGVTLSGDNLPGYLYDAIRMAQREVKIQEAAMDEAVHNA